MSDGVMRIDLRAPVPKLSVGPFSFDPIKLALGTSIEELLSPLCDGPVREETAPARVQVFPIELAHSLEVLVPVTKLGGHFGLRNEQGHLVVTVPMLVAGQLHQRLLPELSGGTALGPRNVEHDGKVSCEFALAMFPGRRFGIPLGSLGELSLTGRA